MIFHTYTGSTSGKNQISVENENYGLAINVPEDCPPPYPSHTQTSLQKAYPKLQQPQSCPELQTATVQCDQWSNNPQSKWHAPLYLCVINYQKH